MASFEAEVQRAAELAGYSRRELLRRVALGACGLAVPTGMVVISGCARPAADKSAAPTDKIRDADYTLHAARRQAAPDGRPRQVFCYNGDLPGPVIRAKLGDKLRVKVVNDLDVPTSVHWHGMHQPGTWTMDGVANVSRPPIPPGESFVYEFEATPAGTHWYHSHTGVQYGDGLFGLLIVEEPTPPARYDREEIVLVNDWFLKSAEEILAGLLKEPAADMAKMDMSKSAAAGTAESSQRAAPTGMKKMSKPAGEKMAGMKGMPPDAGEMKPGMAMRADIGDVPFDSALINGRGRFGNDLAAPLATIDVKAGEILRLRLINGSSTYAFRFQVDGHRLTVIASDGAPIKPVEVDNLLLNAGERYDVLLEATGSGATWIRAATLAGNEVRAILRYAGAPSEEPEMTPFVWGPRMLSLDDMRSPAPVSLADKPRQISWRLGGSMAPFAWSINDQFWPKADPVKLAADEPVRFVIENPTGMDHPFHLHGHYFYVLGKPDALNLVDPPQKDTVNIPSNSNLVLQWRATNPGHWFFHCHIEWHVETGMARVIEIAPA